MLTLDTTKRIVYDYDVLVKGLDSRFKANLMSTFSVHMVHSICNCNMGEEDFKEYTQTVFFSLCVAYVFEFTSHICVRDF